MVFISANNLCLEREHAFEILNNREPFKSFLIVKMRAESWPFAGRDRNSAVFTVHQPRLNSRNHTAIAVLVRAENVCLCA